jgi:hypothetical protein
MAFPEDPLEVDVDLMISGVWTGIAQETYSRNPISINRGQSDQGNRADHGKCSLTLDNRSGKYSPRNPMSPYYGLIGRNTPLRVSVRAGAPYLELPGVGRASTPDAVVLDITGDLDVRVEVSLDDWDPTQAITLAGKYDTAGNQRSWLLAVGGTNRELLLRWSADGAGYLQFGSTVPIPVSPSGRIALRSTLDVDNGAGGRTVTHYTGPGIAGPWIQLGAAGVTAGITSVYAGTAPLEAGDVLGADAGVFFPPVGGIHALEVRSGIGGTVVADPDFTAQTLGATSFTDTAGLVWTLGGDASIGNRQTRFVGEISSWPPRWDVSGQDVWMPLQAAGILRRLGQGATPLQSVLRREMTTPEVTPAQAYWPCEDSEGATSVASALGGQPMRIVGAPTMSSFDGFACSDLIPVMTTGSSLIGAVPPHASTGEVQCRWLMNVPAAGATSGQRIISVATSLTAARWDVIYHSSGYLSVEVFNSEGGQIYDSGLIFFQVDGKLLRVSLEMTQNGINLDYRISTLEVGAPNWFTIIDTLLGQSVGHAKSVTCAPDRGLDGVAIGHIAVYDTITTILDLKNELDAWQGETAGRRIERLCRENEITFRTGDDLDDTAAMGPQRVATLLSLLDDAAEADLGMLYEIRNTIGLAYRTRSSLYNQTAVLALDYTAPGEVAPPLEPDEDDENVRNDRTVERRGGTSARAIQETGPLSVQPPPDGVGRYDDSVTLNLATDDQLPDVVGWLLHLGTWDEARYPTVHVDLAAAPGLADEVLALDVRDRLTVANLPVWLPPDDISLLAQGYTETIGVYDWDMMANCSAAGPWTVAVADDTVLGRADTDGSELAAGVTSTATSLSVTVTDGPLWTTDAAEVPFDVRVGGEVMTATAITGSVEDAFGRSVSDGWGDADVGGSWTNSGGAAANFDVTGSAGTHTLTSVATPHFSAITAPHADFDIYVDVATDQLATGGPIEAGPMGRFTSANNLYQARLSFATSQVITLQIVEVVGGAGAVLDSFTTGLTHVATTFYRIRFQGIGSALRAKTWETTDAEPPWQLNITDASLAAAGSVGCRSRLDGANTNVNPVVSWDNFALLTPQVFTVTRSVNGIVKAHGAGADVRLAYPVVAAL